MVSRRGLAVASLQPSALRDAPTHFRAASGSVPDSLRIHQRLDTFSTTTNWTGRLNHGRRVRHPVLSRTVPELERAILLRG
jgi:hypothetical protein